MSRRRGTGEMLPPRPNIVGRIFYSRRCCCGRRSSPRCTTWRRFCSTWSPSSSTACPASSRARRSGSRTAAHSCTPGCAPRWTPTTPRTRPNTHFMLLDTFTNYTQVWWVPNVVAAHEKDTS